MIILPVFNNESYKTILFSGLDLSLVYYENVKMNFKIISLMLMFYTAESYAKNAIYFYKSPNSLFPSGQTDIYTLENSLKKSETTQSIIVEKNGLKKNLPKSLFAVDLDTSEFVIKTNINKKLQIIQPSDEGYLVRDINTGLTFHENKKNLVPDSQDPGRALAIKKLSLFSEPSWKSRVIGYIPEKSLVKVLDFTDHFFKVSIEEKNKLSIGYVENAGLILKYDFASFALNEKNQWMPVEYRLGDSLILKSNQRMKIKNIKAFLTRADLAISIEERPTDQLLPRQRWKIVSDEKQTWYSSELKGHGLVFWKKPGLDLPKKTIFIEEILKKEITSMSVDSKNPQRALISAGGIFYTEDGIIWSNLEPFGKKNYPVLIDNKSHLIVGDQRSTDNGKNFYPFINWQQVTKVAQEVIGVVPKHIVISNITQKNKNTIHLEIDTGGRIVKLETLPIHIQ
jgi:hypothetical protein